MPWRTHWGCHWLLLGGTDTVADALAMVSGTPGDSAARVFEGEWDQFGEDVAGGLSVATARELAENEVRRRERKG